MSDVDMFYWCLVCVSGVMLLSQHCQYCDNDGNVGLHGAPPTVHHHCPGGGHHPLHLGQGARCPSGVGRLRGVHGGVHLLVSLGVHHFENNLHVVAGAVPPHHPVDVPRAGRGDEVVILAWMELHGVGEGREGSEGEGEDPVEEKLKVVAKYHAILTSVDKAVYSMPLS